MEEKEKSSLSVDIDKELILKFKSMCVLREHTMSEEIEKMIADWVELNKGEPESRESGTPKPAQAKPAEQTPESGDLSDKLEEQAEKS